ncbi:MAG: DUF47 family protein [Proteobacteria bacterium]|nr:DUF47 family protein [Pseudomonadota bacterium]
MSPKSDNYFTLFNELAACTVRGARIIARMSLIQDPAAFDQLFDEITRTEGEADEVTKQIFLALHKTFITPFDRWEIKDLAMALDDMFDCMEDIPQRARLYGPGNFTKEMASLGQINLRAVEKVQEAVLLLSDMKNAARILKICQEIGSARKNSTSCSKRRSIVAKTPLTLSTAWCWNGYDRPGFPDNGDFGRRGLAV